jgi:hypothetical protein
MSQSHHAKNSSLINALINCTSSQISQKTLLVSASLNTFKRLLQKNLQVCLSSISICFTCEPGSSVSVWLQTGRPGDLGSIPGRGERIFPLSSVSRPALGLTQPPIQWVPGVLSPGLKRSRGMTQTTHPHLVPRSRMGRNFIYSAPNASVVCSGTALALYASYA